MKAAVQIVRIIVGVLFIFSGLVKANDPMGLSYKMQEFFEVWKLHGFNSWTLWLSILMNAFEIIAGFALLLGWRIKLFSWLLLMLIVAFTFLTGYTYITGNPKNCGCFGDCLLISSKTSFLKDVALLILIAFIIWKRNLIRPLFSERYSSVFMLIITLFSFGFQYYTLNYLPVVDCLPYKKGNNIAEKMKMPANAIPDSTVITFVYTKDGKDVEFTASNFPADFNTKTYTNMRRYDKVIREGKNNQPPVKGFTLSGETNTDSTQFVLEQPYAVLLFIEKFADAGKGWKKKMEEIVSVAKAKNITCFIITAEPGIAVAEIKGSSFESVPVFKCDYKAIQTAARVTPTVYLLKEGTVQCKYGGVQISKLKKIVGAVPVQKTMPPPSPVEIAVPDSLSN